MRRSSNEPRQVRKEAAVVVKNVLWGAWPFLCICLNHVEIALHDRSEKILLMIK